MFWAIGASPFAGHSDVDTTALERDSFRQGFDPSSEEQIRVGRDATRLQADPSAVITSAPLAEPGDRRSTETESTPESPKHHPRSTDTVNFEAG